MQIAVSVHLSVFYPIQLNELSYHHTPSYTHTYAHGLRALDILAFTNRVARKCRETVPSAGAVQVKCHLLCLSHGSWLPYKQTHAHMLVFTHDNTKNLPALPENAACLWLIVCWMPANTCICAYIFVCHAREASKYYCTTVRAQLGWGEVNGIVHTCEPVCVYARVSSH